MHLNKKMKSMVNLSSLDWIYITTLLWVILPEQKISDQKYRYSILSMISYVIKIPYSGINVEVLPQILYICIS